MNLKITLLIALIISANIFTINAMNDKEKDSAIEEINLIIQIVELVNTTNVTQFKELSPEKQPLSKTLLTDSKSNYIKTYSSAIQKIQISTIPETHNPNMNLLFTISRRVVPLFMATACLEAINKIDGVLSEINTISNEEKNNAINEIDKLLISIQQLNRHIELFDELAFEGFKASQQDILRCKNSFINTKSKFSEAYLKALKDLHNNVIPETNDFKIEALFIVSRKIVPLSKAIIANLIINKIDQTLNLLNQK
jgi:hypothetical protein